MIALKLSLIAFTIFSASIALAEERILPELVKKCDKIDDEFLEFALDDNVWDNIMRCLNGKIGPVNHHHISESGTSTVKSGAFGTAWKGPDSMGPKVFPNRGKYITDKPSSFTPTYKKLVEKAKKGDPDACGEVAAAIFVKAITNKSFTATKMFEYFRAAGIAGSADAIFMCGVCGYYGIGTLRNRKDAIKALKIWQNLTHAELREGGWVQRRLSNQSKGITAQARFQLWQQFWCH